VKPDAGVRMVSALLVLGLLTCGTELRAAEDVSGWIDTIEQTKAPAGTKDEEGWARDRTDARTALVRAGAAAVRPLVALIQRSKQDFVRISALTALAEIEPPRALRSAVPLMTGLLKDKNPGIRYLAAQVLGQARHAPAALLELVDDKQVTVRLAAADAIANAGELDPKAAAVALLKLADLQPADDASDEVQTQCKTVRLHAIAALARPGVVLGVVPKLIEKLESKDVNEREAAVAAIEELLGYNLKSSLQWDIQHTAKGRKPIIEKFRTWWEAATIGIVLTDKLIGTLESRDAGEREAAADTIKGRIGYDLKSRLQWDKEQSAEERAPLIQKLRDRAAKGKMIVVGGRETPIVTRREGPELTFRLNVCRDERQPTAIRQCAARFLGKLGTKDVARDFEEILYTKDKGVRKTLAPVASKLSCVPIDYRDAYTENEWLDIVRRWGQKVR